MKLIYDTNTAKLLPWPRTDDLPVVGLEPHLLEMDVVHQAQPLIDTATERLGKTETIDTDAKTVTYGWNVVALPPEVFSAEQWLDEQGVGGSRQPTLLYLKQSLMAAGKTSPLLNSLEQYLQTILALYVTDPAPRADWPLPPTSFEAAVQEAMQQLNTP